MTVSDETIAYRQQFAAEQRRDLAAAIEACGPDADAYGRWTLHDKLGLEPPCVTFCCRRDGQGWQPEPPPSDERVLLDVATFTTRGGIKYEARPLTIGGVTHYLYRWDRHIEPITEYRPRTREQLEAAAQRREAKRAEKFAVEPTQLELGL